MSRRFSAARLLTSGGMFLSAAAGLRGQAPPADPALSNQPAALSPAEDPNAPGLSRAERIQRQESLIRRRIEEARAAAEAQKQEVLNAQQQAAGGPEAQEQARLQREGEKPPMSDAQRAEEVPEPPPGGWPVIPPPAQPGQPGAEAPAAAGPGGPGELKKKDWKGPKEYVATVDPNAGNALGADRYGFAKVNLYLSPASCVAAAGTTFRTQVRLMTLDKNAANRVDLVVAYPREHVRPESVHQDRLVGLLEGEPEFEIDEARGIVRYSARFKAPIEAYDKGLIEIVWRALTPAEDIQISLARGRLQSTAHRGKKLLTETQFGKGGRLASASLRIIEPPRAVPSGERVVEDPLTGFAPALASSGHRPGRRPPVLWIDYQPSRESHKAGDWVAIDVHLENPDRAAFDEASAVLAFDPEVLEVVDADERNLIREGANILDGPFREHWDWDRLIANRVDASEGRIVYRMGRSTAFRPASGVLARIMARVRMDTDGSLVQWVWNDGAGPNPPGTGVFLLGEDLYGRLFGKVADTGAPGAAAKALRADPASYR